MIAAKIGANPFTKVRPATKPQNSDLLKLPPEIRNMIYQWTFQGSVVKIQHQGGHGYGPSPRKSTATGLVLACKQIHAESIRMYYALATFSFGYGTAYCVKMWRNLIGPDRAALVQDIRLCQDRYDSWFAEPRDSDETVRMVALSCSRCIKQVQMQAKLPDGVLKTKLHLENGHKAWTADPIGLAEKVLKTTAYCSDYHRVWIEEPPLELKALFPRIKTLEEAKKERLLELQSLQAMKNELERIAEELRAHLVISLEEKQDHSPTGFRMARDSTDLLTRAEGVTTPVECLLS